MKTKTGIYCGRGTLGRVGREMPRGKYGKAASYFGIVVHAHRHEPASD